jgi:plastocyanin domain-containing protein
MKTTVIAIAAAVLVIGGTLVFVSTRGSQQAAGTTVPANNVTMVDGKQVIDLTAKGGYSPMESVAKAGVPTVLRVSTKGTFDCSSGIRIPSMGISKNLPQTGVTEIDLGSPQLGTLQGTCGMGMYPFEIEFRG